ncbi:MAG: DsbC family protein [Nitrospira sp.]|jgi:thiol:disulfide interchange protein DsbC|nr:DsbC family protein [Nitrospira sp.]
MSTTKRVGVGLTVAVMVVCEVIAFGQVSQGSERSDVPQMLQSTMEQKFPGMKLRRVAKTEIPSWYLVETESDSPEGLWYVHESGRYVLAGGMFDIQLGRNVTQEYLRERERRVLDSLDLSKTILLQPESPKITKPLLVVDDLDCPVCQKLHPEIKKLVSSGIPVAVLLHPLTTIHPDAYRKSVAVWCSSDRAASLDKALTAQPIENPAQLCQHPVDDILKFGRRLKLHKTPTVFLPSGQRLEGFVSAEQLLSMLQLDASKP